MAKQRAAGLPRFDKRWKSYRVGLMVRIIAAKYKTVGYFRQTLNSTKGQMLTHPVNCDFWGTGFGREKGMDLFAKLLMECRDRNQPTQPQPSTNGPAAHHTAKNDASIGRVPHPTPSIAPAAPVAQPNPVPNCTPFRATPIAETSKKRTLEFSPDPSPTQTQPNKRTCPSVSPKPSTSTNDSHSSSPKPSTSYAAAVANEPTTRPTAPEREKPPYSSTPQANP
jgi:hypothetical protein